MEAADIIGGAATLVTWAIPIVYLVLGMGKVGAEQARRSGAFWGMAADAAVTAVGMPLALTSTAQHASTDIDLDAQILTGLLVIGAILYAIFFICLKVAPTALAYNVAKGTKANSVPLGVIALIFCNPVSGILLLCSKKDARGLGADMSTAGDETLGASGTDASRDITL